MYKNDNMLALQNIEVEYGSKTIFKGLNFSIDKNEKISIVGQSGMGKTTMFHTMLGFNRIKSGTVLYNGKEIHNLTQLRNHIAFLPQDQNILGHGNVKNLIFAPFDFIVNKKNKPSLESIISAFQQLGLKEDLLSSDFENLSGGERQRIGLVIAKHLKRDIILLDEPTSALDPDSTLLACKYIRDDGSSTVLSISHDEIWQNACGKIVDFKDLINLRV